MKPMQFKVRAKDSRNEMHFAVQVSTRAQVFDDRRKRKPKHKKNLKYFY